jgi:hypothetical protein
MRTIRTFLAEVVLFLYLGLVVADLCGSLYRRAYGAFTLSLTLYTAIALFPSRMEHWWPNRHRRRNARRSVTRFEVF